MKVKVGFSFRCSECGKMKNFYCRYSHNGEFLIPHKKHFTFKCECGRESKVKMGKVECRNVLEMLLDSMSVGGKE